MVEAGRENGVELPVGTWWEPRETRFGAAARGASCAAPQQHPVMTSSRQLVGRWLVSPTATQGAHTSSAEARPCTAIAGVASLDGVSTTVFDAVRSRTTGLAPSCLLRLRRARMDTATPTPTTPIVPALTAVLMFILIVPSVQLPQPQNKPRLRHHVSTPQHNVGGAKQCGAWQSPRPATSPDSEVGLGLAQRVTRVAIPTF